MWKIATPSITNSAEILIRALTRGNGIKVFDYSTDDVSEVSRIYSTYNATMGKPEGNQNSGSLTSEFLLAIYNAYDEVQLGKRLADVRKTILSSTNKCPLCGINSVSDLDHYLPRSKYKVFAIYPMNLVPACNICNNAKRASGCEDNFHRIVHSYFEEIPDEVAFLDCTIHAEDSIRFQFHISETASISDELRSVLNFHFARLRLGDRLAAEAISFLGDQSWSFEYYSSVSCDGNGFRGLLEQLYCNFRSRLGQNHWKTALLKSLSNCQYFLTQGHKATFSVPGEKGV